MFGALLHEAPSFFCVSVFFLVWCPSTRRSWFLSSSIGPWFFLFQKNVFFFDVSAFPSLFELVLAWRGVGGVPYIYIDIYPRN